MKACLLSILVGFMMVFPRVASATQADDITITIAGQTAGATPFLSQLTLTVSDTTVLKSIQFTVTPKPGSVTRPLSGTYASDYLLGRGNIQPPNIFLPIYGLYDDYSNTVTLTYRFLDGSSKEDVATITTAIFDDTCGYKDPIILQARSHSTDLSYDYILVKGSCNYFQPGIIDTDGALRWVGTANLASGNVIFFDNAIYLGHGRLLTRIDLDGTVTLVEDYTSLGVVNFHHNIDRGKFGMILDADTTAYFNSVNLEVDAAGTVLKQWNMADIISAAMIAGGDDPSEFVYPSPTDWFHNNSATYNRADDSVIISSRENFLICLDYETDAIKWILGDPTKKWHEFPSLAQYALTLAPGSLPPIGQHAISVTFDQHFLILDNGQRSVFQVPQGVQRNYASPRKYKIDQIGRVATEIWNFEMDQSIFCPFCGSVYEDAPLNYLLDYSFTDPLGQSAFAQLLGLSAGGETIFYYQYPTTSCTTAYRALPLHLENTKFPTVGPQALNLSTRGVVSTGDNVLIGGFIITGTDPKTMVLRALGPSLNGSGLSGVLADPVLNLYDSSDALIATNDDWASDPDHLVVESNGLTPGSSVESATAQTLVPGAYTVIVSGKNATQGIGLVELYDLSPLSNSKLGNISTRGEVGIEDDVMIGGFIVGEVDNATVVVRALGPSLANQGISNPLPDPLLTIYDSNGTVLVNNDNWLQDPNYLNVQERGLAPSDQLEAAIALHPPAGAYTAIVSGANGATGISLVEVFDLGSNVQTLKAK